MVGTGTGIAPFLAFLQELKHRVEEKKEMLGKAVLVVGCRNRGEWIGEAVCRSASDTGVLTLLSVAMSREGGSSGSASMVGSPSSPYCYVTDALRGESAMLWEILQQPGCNFYCCGDGRMAGDAYEALLAAIMKGSSISRARAVSFVDTMRIEGRYHLDIWGVVKQGGVSLQPKVQDVMRQRFLEKIARRFSTRVGLR
jgi:sulfite reductase alpha subunit-like flavoprotein